MAEVVFRETYKDILSPQQMEYMMEMMYSKENLMRQMTSEGHIYFIDEGRGYVSYRHDCTEDDGKEVFHLEKIYVMPACQGTGLGKELFNRIKDEMPAGVRCRIELNVNRHNRAVSFYKHMGMTVQRSGDFPIGNGYFMNDYIMELQID